ncbi:MAG: tetratricopeptide repeat protein, partial [Methanoregulaceae archaeon]|nr:tetratricopeptide repeat protein [Methanoregulaceae archaeon]
MILVISGLIAGTSFLVAAVERTTLIETKFNFPRFLSATEIHGPPQLPGEVRYVWIKSDEISKGEGINWSKIRKGGPYDIVVIGDSFLGKPEAGHYFVKKFAIRNNFSVLHIQTNFFYFCEENPAIMLGILTKNGFLKDVKAKYVILGLAERGLFRHMSTLLQPDGTYVLPGTNGSGPGNNGGRSPGTKPVKGDTIGKLSASLDKMTMRIDRFFEDAGRNITLVKTWVNNDILSLAGEKTNDGSVRFAWLNESRFSHPVYHKRLIYNDKDLTFRNITFPESVIEMNDMFDTYALQLRNDNITLVFIPGISAYSTYYDYIENPPSVRNPFYKIMDELNRTYVYIDMKRVADEKQAQGVHDLSGVGDFSHWTWRLTEDIPDLLPGPVGPGRDITPTPTGKRSEYINAVKAFRGMIYENGRTDPWALNNDARLYLKNNNTERAIACYRKSLVLDPHQPDV